MHYTHLSENLTLTDPANTTKIIYINQWLMSKGLDQTSATKAAEEILAREVNGQASFLTYKDLFIYLGYFFLVLVPGLIFFRNKKRTNAAHEESVEWALE